MLDVVKKGDRLGSPRALRTDLHLRPLIVASLIFGFLLIPLQEIGRVVLHWLTGNPEGMSYARDYLLGNGVHTFFGVLGGPLLPLLVSAAAVVLIYRSSISLSTLYPIALLGAVERLVSYVTMGLPSDEFDLSMFLHWDGHMFKYIILGSEIILLGLIMYSMFRLKLKWQMQILCIVIPIVSFVVMAAFGVLVIERFLFPAQYHLQFG